MKYPPEFKVVVERENCIKCLKCTKECPFGVHEYDKEKEKWTLHHENCVACQRCVLMCPAHVINIERRPPCSAPTTSGQRGSGGI